MATEDELNKEIQEQNAEINESVKVIVKLQEKLNKQILRNKNLTIKNMRLQDEVRLLIDAVNKAAPTNS